MTDTNLTDDQKEILQSALHDTSGHFATIDSARDLIKAIVNDTSEELDIPKKILNKLVKVHYKNTLDQDRTELDHVSELLEIGRQPLETEDEDE